MASRCGRDSTIQKISNRFFWDNIKGDVEEFIRNTTNVRRRKTLKKYQVNFLASPSTEVIQQIGIDICSLPKFDSLNHLVVCKDYFNKWSEAKPIKDKSASNIAQFLYEVICRHGRFRLTTKGGSLLMKLAKFYTT